MKRSRLQWMLAGGLAGTLGLATAASADQNPSGIPAPADERTPQNTATGSGNPGDVSGRATAGSPGPTTPGVNSNGRVLGSPVANDVNAATSGATGDADFIRRVHDANQDEVKMARLALDKAQSPKVKNYAQKLVNDHQAADKKLMAYADRKAPEVKAEARSTPEASPAAAHHDETYTRLSSLSGADFDKEFVNAMVEDHDKAIDLVKNARDAASDKQLRALYDGMVPKLEAHKKMAKELADKVVKS
jgi:putative membrane protein